MMPEPGRQKPRPYLRALADGAIEVLGGATLRADEVVAVDRRRHRHPLAAGHHELEDRHLARHVLQRHAIHAQLEDGLAALPLLALEIVGVRDEDLLAERERPAEQLASAREAVGHGGIE